MTKTRLALLLLVLLCPARSAGACPIPVFRYALENWPPDRYTATVFHRGALNREESAALETLRGARTVNLGVETVDLTAAARPANRAAAATLPAAHALPWLAARLPGTFQPGPVFWQGQFTRENAGRLVDSSLRRRVISELLDKTAVWVLVPGGDRRKDRAAENTLREELARLEKTLQAPSPEWSDGTPPAERIVYKIAFSIFTLDPGQPEEAVFAEMLRHTEPDLADFRAEPVAFPIFGRGRALYALVGAGINARTIAAAGEFLVGSCSCQVKRLNPGTDLLFAADWDTLVRPGPAAAPPPVGIGTFPGRAREAAEKIGGSRATE